jgi:hypothetical protein
VLGHQRSVDPDGRLIKRSFARSGGGLKRSRYQTALYSPVSATPLAAVSGENGTTIWRSHGTSWIVHCASSSIEKSQRPLSENHSGRRSSGRG